MKNLSQFLPEFIKAIQETLVMLGLGLTLYGLGHAGDWPSVAQVAVWALMIVAGTTIAASFWSLISSITFWTVQGEGILWTLDDMYEHVRWPLGIFPGALKVVLSTVFPLGLAVTVPAEALIGRLDWGFGVAAVGLALVFAGAARGAWLLAVRRYEGASA